MGYSIRVKVKGCDDFKAVPFKGQSIGKLTAKHFEKVAPLADIEKIVIDNYDWYGSRCMNFQRTPDGKFLSPVREIDDYEKHGYYRDELRLKEKFFEVKTWKVDEDAAQKLIAEDAKAYYDSACKSLDWVDPKDENDTDGRYWISCYHGCGVYRLVIQHGKIVGALKGGYGETCPSFCSRPGWIDAVNKAVADKIGPDFSIVKADGSGTYFYLRDYNDMKLLDNVKEYDVPSFPGGVHHNMEIH